ncbi:uncharacterized protein LOC129608086 [Condylostylus longicornis]|uniref:uncharacterized protein LOC129608086 n=1 Tax=Condylostylus longicornis TaxID=2530218 RepID=UPI00244E077F|nr:uncharacterized protein LOC129608086 [Condylostylus longicornis]
MPWILDGNNGIRTRKRLKDNDLNLGTWNIRTMLQSGKMQEVAYEMLRYKIDILAIQETRWKGYGKINKQEYIVYYSGDENRRGMYGTGFIINKKLRNNILGFTPVDSRLCSLRLKGKFCIITVIFAYAPTEDSEEQEKDVFYDNLSTLCEKAGSYDTLILLGDFNAKVGKEEFVLEVAGKHSLHDNTSANGLRLCQLASEAALKVKSTCFERKDIYKGTWRVPGSQVVNQIDHVLISSRRASSILNVRSCRGANCDSDHFLVKLVLRQRIANVAKERGIKRIKWDTEKLKTPEIRERFQSRVNEILNANNNAQENESVNEEWKRIENTLNTVANEVVGRKPIERNIDWFDNECKQVEKIQEAHLEGNTREVYRRTKYQTKGYQAKLNVCKDSEGNLIVEESKVMDRWVEYFQKTLNEGYSADEENVYDNVPLEPVIDMPTIDELRKAVDKLKNNKAPGKSGITIELVRGGGEILLKPFSEVTIGEYQCGFRKNRSTVDQIFLLKQTMEKCYEYNMDLHILCIDFQRAFDSVKRSKIREALIGRGIPHKLIQMTLLTMQDSKTSVLIQGQTSKEFAVKAGVRQGDALSTLIFNMVLQHAIGTLENGGHIFTRPYQIMAYADDVCIVSKSYRTMAETFVVLAEMALEVGLLVNEEKTKYLRMSRDERRRAPQNITIGEYNFEGVTHFRYLGATIFNDNSMHACINENIQNGNRSYYANKKLFQSRLLSRNLKTILYKTTIRPIVTYGCEAWSLTQGDENNLKIFERKILRKIFGPKRLEDGAYLLRTNEELNQSIHGENIVKHIKSQRLRWAGHLARMHEDRKQKRTFEYKPLLSRGRGRPRARWIDGIESDLRTLGVRDWKREAENRAEWRQIVKKAKSHHEM